MTTSRRNKDTVTMPDNADYQARIAAAKRQGPPVGGAPMPHIPRLDQLKQPQSSPQQTAQSNQISQRILSEEQRNLLAKQGQLREGVGSAFVCNQPAVNKPAEPIRPDGAGLRPETIAQLEEVAKLNEQIRSKPTTEESQESEARAELEDIKNNLDDDDDDEYEGYTGKLQDLLNNKKRRDSIDSRCKPLDLTDLLLHQEIRQTVPIIPGKYEPTFRTLSAEEDFHIKLLMGKETEGSDQYFMDKFAMLQLCMGLYALNGLPFDPHLTTEGKVNSSVFDSRLLLMMRYPVALLNDLSINYVWFLRRVRKLMAVDVVQAF